MNYLSHFYVHERPGNAYFNTGLVLPDLARSYVKRFSNATVYDDPQHVELQLGCMQHYADDKAFHSSSFFEEGTAACIAEIKETLFDGVMERRWFIGHILFEMLLDRLLVRHQPAVANRFYDQLDQTGTEKLHEFLKLNEATKSEKLMENFGHFRRARYIRNYTDNNLFVYSLSRVLLRARLPELSAINRGILEDCITKLEAGPFKEAYSVLLAMKNVF